MISNYYRVKTIDEALKYLALPNTRPMGGGTWLNQPHDDVFSVVDLQALDLNKISNDGNNLVIDACVSLQQLMESPECPQSLKQAIRLEAGLNIRNAATVAGILVACDGRSAISTVMLGLDAKLTIAGKGAKKTITLGEYLPLRQPLLITSITIPLNVKSAFESVGRTAFDKPIVCCAVTQWSNGRTRLALGGCKHAPLLAMDGTEAEGIEAAARNAFHEAGDEWASSEYRVDVAATLAKRCLESVKS